jgi:hypothetical protein
MFSRLQPDSAWAAGACVSIPKAAAVMDESVARRAQFERIIISTLTLPC